MTNTNEQAYRDVINAQQKAHGERASKRHAINGQPNGYKPITEAELQTKHALDDAFEQNAERQRILKAARAA